MLVTMNKAYTWLIVFANGRITLKFMMMKLRPSSMLLANVPHNLSSVLLVPSLNNAILTALVSPLLQSAPLTADIRIVGLMVVVGSVACVLTLIPVTMALVNLHTLHRQPLVNLLVPPGNVGLMGVVVLVVVLMVEPASMAFAQRLRPQSVFQTARTIHVDLMAVVALALVLMADPVAMANVCVPLYVTTINVARMGVVGLVIVLLALSVLRAATASLTMLEPLLLFLAC
jgi:hypothetical protein